MRQLCPFDALPQNVAVAVQHDLIAIRLDDCVRVYRNACPHLGLPLDWAPGRFMSVDGLHLVCAMHGAEFRMADGLCLRGPCRGERLTALPAEVRDGYVFLLADREQEQDQGRPPWPEADREKSRA